MVDAPSNRIISRAELIERLRDACMICDLADILEAKELDDLSSTLNMAFEELKRTVCNYCGKPAETKHCSVGGCPLGADL